MPQMTGLPTAGNMPDLGNSPAGPPQTAPGLQGSTPPVPQAPSSLPTAEDWKKRITACEQRRKELLPFWKDNVNFRVQKPFGGTAAGSDSQEADRVAVPEDWARTKQKTAQLSFQLPKIVAESLLPENEAANPLVSAAVNEMLSRECRAGYVIDECLADVINAAGLMIATVGVNIKTETLQIPGAPGPPDPVTLQPGPPTPMSVSRKVYQKFTMDRVSPAHFLWPREFVGSDWSKAPWLGYSTYMKLTEAKKVDKWAPKLVNFDGGTSHRELLSEDITVDQGAPARDDEKYIKLHVIWYKAYLYDPTCARPEQFNRVVLADDVDDALEDGPSDWQTWIDATPSTPPGPPGPPDPQSGQPTPGAPGKPAVPGHFKGLRQFPIIVGTLTYVSDTAIPPSDSAAARPQVREMIRSRSQMLRQRDFSIPIRWYDVNRIDEQIIEKMRQGDWQDMIPMLGPGERAIGEVARASYPRENFQFQEVIGSDLDRAWSLSPNQLGAPTDTTRTASEVNVMQSATSQRLDYEKGRVNQFVAEAAAVVFQLMQQFLTEPSYVRMIGPAGANVLQQVTASDLTGEFAFSFVPDSSDRIDAVTRQQHALKMYNLLANSPSINRVELEKELLEKFGMDPRKLQTQPPAPQPEAPNISYRFSGEDLLNPMVIALLQQAGHLVTPEQIAAGAKAIEDSVKVMHQARMEIQVNPNPTPPSGGAQPPQGPQGQPPVTPPTPSEPVVKRAADGSHLT